LSRPSVRAITSSPTPLDDGFIRSVILSRYPITSSVSRLHGSDLAPYGYTGSGFTRDLFEAQISIPGFSQPLHVFTAHLKSATDADSSAKRAAEAGAVSNFFATVYLPANGQQPYILSGDMNEDILRPSPSNPQSIQRLASTPTGLQLTTAVNPFTDSELTMVHSGRRPDQALRLHPAVCDAVFQRRQQPGFPHRFAESPAAQPVQQ
jgi:endonuclease/exonuclease/phosphatase family metal-dependent hydrolase